MNKEELFKLKKELNKLYKKTQKEYSDIDCEFDKKNIEEVLKNILKERNKIDKIIEIYQNDDKSKIVMKLEILYMMLLSGVEEKNFNSLSEENIYAIFDKYFSDEWVYKYNIEEKEKMLLNAISKNEMLNL